MLFSNKKLTATPLQRSRELQFCRESKVSNGFARKVLHSLPRSLKEVVAGSNPNTNVALDLLSCQQERQGISG